jgi:amidohydrolase
MLQRALSLADSVIALRRQVHQHPELGFREEQTAALAAQRLSELGLSVRTAVGKTGVIGDLGEGGRCIAIRADMDALPIQEENQVPYASCVPGIMHACGHDAHVACLLGAAQLLSEEAAAGRLAGRVRFLFQPSEEAQDAEALSGGMRMAAEGAMEGANAVLALHVWTDLAVGAISTRDGTMTAHPDKFELTILGQEAHGAYPHRGHDAITLAAQVIQALQTVVSRRTDPTHARVLTVGTIQGGTKDNILAGSVAMTGTIRTFDAATRDVLLAEMERACSLARVLGGDYRLKVIPGYLPVENDPRLTALVRRVGGELLGAQNVLEAPLEMGGEDFSYFAQSAPGCMFWLGASTPGEPKRLHHHPHFDIDERCLPLGTALLAEIALRYLKEGTL